MSRKSNVLFYTFLTLLIGPALSEPAFALEGILKMQSLVEARITPIVHELDPHALVFVNLRPRKKETALPATPFVYRENVIDESRDEIQIERADVVLLTKLTELPPSAKRLIREAVGPIAPLLSIRLKQVPADLVRKPEPVKVVAPPPVEGSEPEAVWKQWLAHGEGIRFGAILMLGALLALVVLQAAGNVREGTDTLRHSLQTGIERIALALEGAREDKNQTDPTESDATSVEPSTFSSDRALWETISDDTYAALLADCYWSEFDSYAAFLWRRIPMARRPAMLARLDFLPEYAAHVTKLREDNYGNEQEPYYLRPLAISHLDNAALTEVVKKSPSLLFRLPPMRVAGLKLDARERIELTKTAMRGPSAPLPDLSALPGSERRRLPKGVLVPLADEAEEKDVLKWKELPPELIESIPSLGWLDKLTESEVARILARFPARDIAAAWVGPEATLNRMRKLLSPLKQRRVDAFVKRFGSSRHSPAYAQLHAAAMARLKAKKLAAETAARPAAPITPAAAPAVALSAELQNEIKEPKGPEEKKLAA